MPRKNVIRSGARAYGKALKASVNPRTALTWWLPSNWRDTHVKDHEGRVEKLKESDQSASDQAPTGNSSAEAGSAAGGFELPEYGSIRPTVED